MTHDNQGRTHRFRISGETVITMLLPSGRYGAFYRELPDEPDHAMDWAIGDTRLEAIANLHAMRASGEDY